MFKIFSRIKRLALDLLLPIECLGCQQEGEYFCGGCQKKLSPNSLAESAHLVKNLFCPHLSEVFIAGNYKNSLLKNLLIKYKYHCLPALSVPLGKFLIDFWKKENPLPKNIRPVIIPIPLSRRRFKWRGFNQSELLARVFADEFDFSLDLDLKRKRHRKTQVKLDEKDRLKNSRGIFSWCGGDLSKKTIILIDDITTTGATLEAAAEALQTAKPQRIYALALAKG